MFPDLRRFLDETPNGRSRRPRARGVMGFPRQDRIGTSDLVQALASDEEGPWGAVVVADKQCDIAFLREVQARHRLHQRIRSVGGWARQAPKS
jgi:hypothetical protein